MPLFTFVADYKGGTYVSQVKATSLKAAKKAWAQQLEPQAISGFGKATHQRVITSCGAAEATQLTGLKNVWFFYVQDFFVNVVSTNQN